MYALTCIPMLFVRIAVAPVAVISADFSPVLCVLGFSLYCDYGVCLS